MPDNVPGVISSNGYVTTSGRSATKTDTPLLETPQAISTVTRTQIDQLQPQQLTAALNYTPGVQSGAAGYDPRYDSFTIRGVDVTYTGVFRDGLREINSPNGLFRIEPYGVEAISVLRGPAASIYGSSSTAGIVDITSKRPLATDFHEIELQSGSYSRKQAAFDLSGPVTPDGSVLYRLTGLFRDADTQVREAKDDRVFIAPAITFQPTDDTKLTILGEYMKSTTGTTLFYANNYYPYTDRTGFTTSQSYGANKEFLGDRRYNDFQQEQGRIGYEFEHRFSDMFTLKQRLRYSVLSQREPYVSAGYPFLLKEANSGISADTFLESRFDTGPVSHTLLTGSDVSDLSYRSKNGYGDVPLGEDPALTNISRQHQNLTGIYAQDQMKFGGWRLTLGARNDWFTSNYRSGTTTDGLTANKQDSSRATYRAALGYVFDNGLAPYVAYGTSFTPNPGTVLNGGVAQPTTGEQVEAGLKYNIPGTNVSLRSAVFDLRQRNAVVYEVVSGVNQQTQLDLHSQGVELEAVASLTTGLNVQASYTYTDATITRLTDATVGNTLTSVPFHQAGIYADYTVQNGALRGFGFGGGVRYKGKSFGDNYNRVVLENKDRVFLDASIRYDLSNLAPQLKGTQLQLSGTNLLNEHLQVCGSGYCYYDEGRKVIASLRYRW